MAATASNTRDSLCELRRVEIPRPQFQGMTYIQTQGRLGIYKTIRAHGMQYGVQMKAPGPRRPQLCNVFTIPDMVKEEDSDGTTSPTHRTENTDSDRSSQMSNYSVSPQPPKEIAPDYPSDYIPNHMRKSDKKDSPRLYSTKF